MCDDLGVLLVAHPLVVVDEHVSVVDSIDGGSAGYRGLRRHGSKGSRASSELRRAQERIATRALEAPSQPYTDRGCGWRAHGAVVNPTRMPECSTES
jgi:hypothetical protein